jgi:hypothetical protein
VTSRVSGLAATVLGMERIATSSAPMIPSELLSNFARNIKLPNQATSTRPATSNPAAVILRGDRKRADMGSQTEAPPATQDNHNSSPAHSAPSQASVNAMRRA